MTKEQRAELKALHARDAKLSREVSKVERIARRRINAIEREISANHARLLRDLAAKQKAHAKPLRAESRVLRALLHRISEGRDAACKERAVIARRIAILEGRLAS